MKKLVLTMAVLVVAIASGAILMAGCGGDGGASVASEPQATINPITGEEVDSLPARPVQVSIPNDTYGAVPQSNISYADIIYEFPVEGDLTRLQAVFYSQFPDKVGPTRSVRYYFVDLAREYKAFHVGYGWGKHAHSYMSASGLPFINGMQDTDLFYRVEDKDAPNDAYINWDDIAAYGGYDNEQTIKAWKFVDDAWMDEAKADKAAAEDTVANLKDSDDPEDQKAVEKAEKYLESMGEANEIKVSSTGCNSTCKYDDESGLYKRFWYGEPYIDKETGEQLTFSNILVQMVHSDQMTDDETGLPDEKGRLEIDMNSHGDAYLFTGGKVIKGTWSKKTPDSRTIFKSVDGKQFRFTPGKTWVYVLDQNKDFSFQQVAAETENSGDEE